MRGQRLFRYICLGSSVHTCSVWLALFLDLETTIFFEVHVLVFRCFWMFLEYFFCLYSKSSNCFRFNVKNLMPSRMNADVSTRYDFDNEQIGQGAVFGHDVCSHRFLPVATLQLGFMAFTGNLLSRCCWMLLAFPYIFVLRKLVGVESHHSMSNRSWSIFRLNLSSNSEFMTGSIPFALMHPLSFLGKRCFRLCFRGA